MKVTVISLLLLFCFANLSLQQQDEETAAEIIKYLTAEGKDFGSSNACPICTILVLLMEEYTVIHSLTIDSFIQHNACSLFKGELGTLCNYLVGQYGGALLWHLWDSSSPDQACRKLGLCSNPECNLVKKGQFPKIKFSSEYTPENQENMRILSETDAIESLLSGMTDNSGSEKEGLLGSLWNKLINGVVKQATKFVNEKEPDFDLDDDLYSGSVGEARGFNWRGKDCVTYDDKIYPGRKEAPYANPNYDYNCNGIYGADPKTGVSYEKQFCDNSGQIGYVVIGDSAGAHFEIPPEWMTAADWNKNTFNDFLPRVLNELDLPHYSGWTGYEPDSADRPCRSLYKYLYQRNKCNHRDYQNLGVNGASSANEWGSYIEALARNQEKDQPVLVFMEFIGNDVCNHEHSFEAMTKPEKFKANILELLDYLDTRLPKGSHVISVGLANGSLLYEWLHNRTHPVGVTYAQVYDYLNCLNISPCWGWMNTNDTVRQITTERAVALTAQYQEIINEGHTWQNFDYAFYQFPANEILEKYQAEGKDPAELIEPIDGFHPGQKFNALMADWYWEALLRDHPDWLGPVNPNNDKITELFGDQGGY